ncbi:hypothetical protein M8818_005483 [Zalaria obscura]|uniref:Uncharacterized protein n=1 Tax=Zalaria obscura TaxID=2024903 RepID=A0ACC3S913_9PEZI
MQALKSIGSSVCRRRDRPKMTRRRNPSLASYVTTASPEGTFPESLHICGRLTEPRSDLLVRHERLSHSDNVQDGRNNTATSSTGQAPEMSKSNKRRKTETNGELDNENHASSVFSPEATTSAIDVRRASLPTPLSSYPHVEQQSGFSLATLSMAAEQAAMSDFTTPLPAYGMAPSIPHLQNSMSGQVSGDPMGQPFNPQDPGIEFGDSLDNLAAFLDNGPFSSYHFSSLVSTEQPVPFFSPESFSYGNDFPGRTPNNGNGAPRLTELQTEEPGSFSRFGSRLPSLQPEDREAPAEFRPRKPSNYRRLADISLENRNHVMAQAAQFSSALPPNFQVPTRLALSRYIAGYINGFHEHMPFLHIPTMSIEKSSVELILAMAAVGAQYCFEGEKGVELFNASQAIAAQRIRRRDARLAAHHRGEPEPVVSTPSVDGVASVRNGSTDGSNRQSLPGPLGLPSELGPSDGLLLRELNMPLPCSAAEFKASNAFEWREARKKAVRGTGFQAALSRLFSRGGKDITEWNSSLGNYVLIHALIQHIFFLRQTARCRFDRDGEIAVEDISSLEQALRNWQVGWRRNPESSLDPMDPNGPVAFNSTALLRLAYIRLNVDTGPGRALDTRDPIQIAHAFRDSPSIKRTPKLVRAVLHSAHALSIPVKIGVRLVARTQTFIWSIQHSLCSLECAFLLSKWLEALSLPNPDPPVADDERRITSLVKTMLDETEFAVPPDSPLENPATIKHLSAGVLRVWATIFRGAQTWAIVDVIGSSLNIYADMLEAG